MANPAPTINQINAFNATQGTTIDFNIIGGTELVRSNRIYIYDLSDNSLICTHLYVSTESIHELPANTDSSIIYESGKSSADFVNGAQYYAQIQTYTDTAGTQGGSGLSVAKMFWCLVNPTLTITTIPSTISTTSYNVSATYDANTSVVSNIIQQYQFSLYSATGSLLQSSGVVVGNGTQQGTSTAYDISYNFTGLSVGSSYYVVVDVTTTQGMSVSAKSNTFTVSIDTPTLGEATVVNNACDGYISVTSNLSGEYGGSGSGEIATFETDSVNDVSSLKVTLTPQQDGTPWIGTEENTEPYLFRAMPTQSNDYNRESGVIVGGTVAWNQQAPNTELTGIGSRASASGTRIVKGHKYLFGAYLDVSETLTTNAFISPYGFDDGTATTFCLLAGRSKGDIYRIGISTASGVSNGTGINTEGNFWFYMNAQTGSFKNLKLFDLTAMFGSTIADYIYNLEQSSAGAGVAWFKKLFPKDYYEYNAGELLSVEGLESHDTVGFNQWDEEWEVGAISVSSGLNTTGQNVRSKNYIPILPNTTYYYKIDMSAVRYNPVIFYDADKNFISSITQQVQNETFTTPSNARYMRFYVNADYGTTYNNDICINLSDPTRNGEYEPYQKHTYPLDSSLTLRGVPKLVDGRLAFDGDIYPPSGEVQRRYGIVDLGTLNWMYDSNGAFFFAKIEATQTVYNYEAICSKYAKNASVTPADKTWQNNSWVGSGYNVIIKDSSYTDVTTFKSAMSGVMLVYELATPTTETAQPYTNPQIVDPDGTEEYVTANYVPVGHDSTYSLVCPISGYDGVSANVVGKNRFNQNIFLNATGWTEEDGVYHGLNTELYNEYPISFPVDMLPYNGQLTFSFDYHNADVSYRSGYAYFRYTDGTESYKELKSADWTHITFTSAQGKTVKGILIGVSNTLEIYLKNVQLELGSAETEYEPYQGHTYTADLGQTVYGGTLDVVSGELVVDRAIVDLGTATWYYVSAQDCFYTYKVREYTKQSPNLVCSNYPYVGIYADLVDKSCGYIYGNAICIRDSSFNQDTSAFKTAMSGVQLCYDLATPQTIQLTPQEIRTLLGTNNVWSNGSNVEITYNIPITNLLVKRQDIADVSGTWLTLYSQPITQASDMDFTFIDFLNQYGKTYKYALVPLLTQTQSGVEVEVEGGYTVSDEVQSVFDGVFIVDQTGSQKCKANVGYGNVDMNQTVGTITPIGAKYPVVITNSQNQYHNGSISGTIVPDDYYFNGNLSRVDMVNKRNELEQFLTNKRAKIIKDWNGNIWLVMIMDNVSCTFNNNYGMGIVNFSTNWIEVGDPTNQQDLQATGLIDVGGA